MPRINTIDPDMLQAGIPGLQGYGFSAVTIDRLGASEYTLVTLAADVSGSVSAFRDLLIESIRKVVDACRKSPKAGNILLRVVTFSDDVAEVHGFKPLSDINDTDYDGIRTRGNTALYDAAATSIGAMIEYGRTLAKQDFGVNGITFILTDGDDNASKFSPAKVREKMREAVEGEILDSMISVLIGINATHYRSVLERFRTEADLTQYVDAGNATPGNLAKLAAFISRSVSSQAGSNGTGQSQQVAASLTI